ncbi:MAG TPA: hypothetical protein VFZ31_12635, partial [Vicinamibacterales bacterium]
MGYRTLRCTLGLALIGASFIDARAQSLPDLTPTRIEFCTSDGHCSDHLSSAAQTFVTVHVKNIGSVGVNRTDGAIAVELVINGSSADVQHLAPALQIGEERSVTFHVPQLAAAG